MSRRYLPDEWIVPRLDDLNRAFFTSGELLIQYCVRCDHWQHPPADLCGRCHEFDLSHRRCEPFGTVVAATVVHRAPHPILEKVVPYNVVVVEPRGLPGVRITGNVIDDASRVSVGSEVRCHWATVGTGSDGTVLRIPQWSRADDAGPGP